ncbi:MAG: GNAT family N-acetyltransferase [Deltaproteobacteria bacterium]|nr:GNAT family N-acetyltransferase [Deltaproteobacteria bacterium]
MSLPPIGEMKPLHVDPEVLGRIVPMLAVHAEAVATLHAADMGDSLWARLGPRFLRTLYRLLIDEEGFLGFVYVEGGRVRGFIAGSTAPDPMMGRLLRRGGFLLAPAALPWALWPPITRRLLDTPRYAQVSAVDGAEVQAESLFCTVEPELRGQKVAGLLNLVLFEELLSRGYPAIKVTTELANTAARRQLRSWGFAERGQFSFYGKEMVVTTLPLAGHPRLRARGRHPMLERSRR